MKTYNRSAMLVLWRTSLGLDTVHESCSVQAVEGLDVDRYIERAMRLWYLEILDRAPSRLVHTADVASRATLAVSGSRGSVTFPADVRRVLSVRLSGWNAPAQVAAGKEAARRLARCASPFGRPGPCRPLVVECAQGVEVMPAAASDTVAELRAVVDPGPEVYILDESLTATIPTSLEDVLGAQALKPGDDGGMYP